MMPERDQVVGMPRDFLAAWLLLILRQWSMHGYALMQQLTTLGFAALDPATVYRTLRQLEKDGLIQSQWDLGSSGPARRTYRLTDAGEGFLAAWAQGLEQFREMLDSFFRFYGLVLPVQPSVRPAPRAASMPVAAVVRAESPPAAHKSAAATGEAVDFAPSVAAAAYDAAIAVAEPIPAVEAAAVAASQPEPVADDRVAAASGAVAASEPTAPSVEPTDTVTKAAAPAIGAATNPPSTRSAPKRAATRSNSRKLPGKGKVKE